MLQQIAIAAGAAVVVGLPVLVGAGQLARRRLARRTQPDGRMVDIGGYRLHIVERGEGPTVVLEGGTWAPGITWRTIAEQLADVARVVTYDRAGLGWSDPSPRPRTAEAMATELHELLRKAEVPGPYLLVGHSFGGTIVRVFAAQHPASVAGVVLLDGAHEDQLERGPDEIARFARAMSTRMPAMLAVLGLLARLGILALRPSLIPAAGPLPQAIVDAVRARIASAPSVFRTMGEEMRQLEAGNAAVRAMAIRSLGSVPLLVISHGRPEGTPPQLGPDVAARYEATWQALQEEQAALSPLGRRMVAEGIGHEIPAEAPDLVVEAIRSLLRPAAAAHADGAAA